MTGPKRLLAGLAALLVAGLLLWMGLRSRGEATQGKEREAPTQSTGHVSQTAEGDPLLALEAAAQARAGLRTQVLTAQALQPEMAAYGRLEEDPSRAFVLRAPVGGILRFAPGRDWPSIGERLPDGAVIGAIEPRLAPAERISLIAQLAAARSELNASAAALDAAREAYERTRILNTDNKNVSDRALQEAAARLKAEEARHNAARDTAQLLEQSLESAGPAGNKPLVLERGGELVELMARPGESIEPGSPILRAAKLDRFIARLDIPLGQHVPAGASAARIYPVGYEEEPIHARRLALAAAVDSKTQGQALLFRLASTRFGIRPGMAVAAYLTLPGSPRQGVVVPRAALVRVAGRSYAYVGTTPGRFVRKEVSLESPVPGGYFTTVNFAPGDAVVVVGGQTLLSEEFKFKTQAEPGG